MQVECFTLHDLAQPMDVSLAQLQRSLLHFLQNRTDLVLFGAYAVNACLQPEVRMTADIDLQALEGETLVTEICDYLHQEFYIETRSRRVKNHGAWRIYQVLKSGNRHLVDVRQVEVLPRFERINQIQVLSPIALMQSKIISAYARQHQPKGFSDLRDLYSLMLTFPQLVEQVEVDETNPGLQGFWRSIQIQEIQAADDDDDLIY
ncbi:nucleotidyl transferase AbiEii/AbiGii toxin family protein [Prochlorothrix hollandica]|uniref:Nucleotidyl transferase AbiEii/AbiGii toxin family protein n=1 Tax=Prochlorothrix hollandica PCC 9006 = CALU 1027 TaxID=317619 RepID=A0A0M2Q1X0_PROHO|nr:nucleotidyl transferase AbiEii/AbiGii toxin family protein [Prochlorothrix hollandica]KKJ00617.1 hypothetical protein PROH_12495 [Prochlorothrix hollandica PCC 9006 = CALU 1027]